MIQRGLTRSDGRPNISALARRAGVAVETARRVVHGKGVADADTVAALAKVLGDDVASWLAWRTDKLEEWTPPSESRLLTREEREVLDRLVRLIVLDRRNLANEGVDFSRVSTIVSLVDAGPSTSSDQLAGRGPNRPSEPKELLGPDPDVDQVEAFLAGDDEKLARLKAKNAERDRRAREAEAARDRGKPGTVDRARSAQDQATERPDAEGPEFGA